MSQAVYEQHVTIAEFDQFASAQRDDALWELVGGRIVMMTNLTEAHEQIAGNIGARLKLAMDGQGCRSYQGGMRVQRSDDRRGFDKPRPDVVVRCGPLSTNNDITDPLVIVEVLSPSTMDNDRGQKLAFYKTLPTLRHIILIYQDSVRVEHYWRAEENWEVQMLLSLDAQLFLDAIKFEVTLAAIYFDIF
jgi:Uma2 family endonuclease